MGFAYITCRDEDEAARIAKALLSKRLIACANLFTVRSLYSWKGRNQDEKEWALLCKTTRNQFKAIERTVKKMHSHKIPCICFWESADAKPFSDWVRKSLEEE